MRPTAAIMAADDGSMRSPNSCTPSRSLAVRTGLVPSVSAPPRVICRSRSMKNGGFVGCQNSTFSREPKSTESDADRVLDHEGVIEGHYRGTILLTTHLSGVVLCRSPAALSGVSLGYKTSKVTHTGGHSCLCVRKDAACPPVLGTTRIGVIFPSKFSSVQGDSYLISPISVHVVRTRISQR
jgi:hypothetical protein